jgi:tetratricopeptide (TPR) repeat protein
MSRRILLIICILLSVTMSAPLAACLWDYDTLAMERQQFPNVLELITGKFLRHSKAFYEWRVRDRREKLKPNAPPQIWDDLAVAYEKLGRHEDAIKTIQEKDSLFPGLYETKANLGTFYFHAGKFELGLQQIDAALAINPDAHFGREAYQKMLVEYLLDKQKDGKTSLPLDPDARVGSSNFGFAKYVLQLGDADSKNIDEQIIELDDAAKGVQGMMRFGDYDSPVLLEALGDLLLSRGYPGAAKQLASRAYLQASYKSPTPEAKNAYRDLAAHALTMQTKDNLVQNEMTLEELETVFQNELSEAKTWFQSIVSNESLWIKESKNLDQEYTKTYYNEPIIITTPEPMMRVSRKSVWFIVSLGVLTTMVAVVILAKKAFRKLRPNR